MNKLEKLFKIKERGSNIRTEVIGGVVTFLPVKSMRPRPDSREIQRALDERGAMGLATELVKYDDYYYNVISNLLGNTLICDNISNATTIAKKYGKQSERWLMGYNKRPDDFAQIDKVVDMYEELGVDRLATWTYRGGYGTSVAAKDPIELWDNIGRNYKRVLKK